MTVAVAFKPRRKPRVRRVAERRLSVIFARAFRLGVNRTGTRCYEEPIASRVP